MSSQPFVIPVSVFSIAAVLALSCERAAPEPVASAHGSVSAGTPSQPAPALASSAVGRAEASGGAAKGDGEHASAEGDDARKAGRCLRPTPAAAVLPAQPFPAHPHPNCPKDPAGAPPMVPIAHVSFPESSAPKLEVEVMLTEAHQARGLMYRRTLAEDRGMLFAWPTPQVHTFWMHNTCLPLDMLFIDADGFITGIVENAPPMTDDGRSIACPVNYVLEVNAGWSARHGVRPGQFVRFEGLPAR